MGDTPRPSKPGSPEPQPDEADLPGPVYYPPGTPELARYCEWWPLGTAGACYAPAAGSPTSVTRPVRTS